MAKTLRWSVFVINVLAFGLISVRGKRPEDYNKDVMLHYKFENISQIKRVLDSSNNGRDATMQVGQIKRVQGKYGKGISLGDHPLNISAIGMSKHFTIAVWIYLNKLKATGSRELFTNCLNCSAENFWAFRIFQTKHLELKLRWRFRRNSSPGSLRFKPYGDNLNLTFGKWHHLAVSYNFSRDTEEQCNFFVDGVMIKGNRSSRDGTTQPHTQPHMPPQLNRTSFIGRKLKGPFNGTIDEFYIFNRTLTENEIQYVMYGTHIRTTLAPTESTSTSHTTTVATTTKESTSTFQPNIVATNIQFSVGRGSRDKNLDDFESRQLESTSTSQRHIVATTMKEFTTTYQPTPVQPTRMEPTSTFQRNIVTTTMKFKEFTSTYQPTPAQTTRMESTPTPQPTSVAIAMKESASTSQPTIVGTTTKFKEFTSTYQPTPVQTIRMEPTSIYQPTPVKTTRMSPLNKYVDEAKKVKNKTDAKELILTFVEEQIVTPGNPLVGAMGKTETLEIMGLIIARKVLTLNEFLSVETSSALILIKRPTSGFTFPHESEKISRNINETMSFPDDMVKTEDGVQRAIVCMSYSDLHENFPKEFTISSGPFKPNTTLKFYSNIIAAAVGPSLNETLANPIKISFTHAKISSGKPICSFWNHSMRTSEGKYGQWSTGGCELDREQSTSTKTVCLCNHLTNFALLLQREGAPSSEPPLSLKIITIIGCTLSILACLLCFFMFLTLKKRDIRHHLHINLAFAIAIAQLILLFGISETKYEILCKALAVFLHYFYLVAFLLMLCEGIHLAILIETAFSHGELKLPAYLIASWGLPAIIVGITFGARFDNYGGDTSCFISPGDGTVYAFVGPFVLVLVINFVILFIVLRQVIRKTSLPISTKAASKFEIVRATIRSLVILFPVMGFTWIFGILFFGFRTLALEYLFAIFCSLQGFFIFLFQYALNSENRLAFLRATRRWRLTFTSSTQTSGNWSKQGGVADNTASKFSLSHGEQKDGNTPPRENCHLVLYRNVDNQGGGTIDSRTTNTYI